MVDTADYRQIARAQLAADEYQRASDSLAALGVELKDEERALRRMKKLAVPTGIGLAVLLLFMTAATFPHQIETYGMTTSLMMIPILLFALAFACAWLACAPAGFIGMWRSFKRSGWFVWGGWVVMATILVLIAVLPCVLGPFYLWSQSRRVKRLKTEVAKARERFAAAERAI